MVTPSDWDNRFITIAARCESTAEPLVKGLWEDLEPAILLRNVLRKAGEAFRGQFTPREMERVANGERRWENNLRWAYRRLRDQGMVRRVARGKFRITERGWQRVAYLNRPYDR